MVVVLSAINGIESLIDKLYTSFDSELFILPREGKTFSAQWIDSEKLEAVDGIMAYTHVIEDAVLIEYGDQRQVATLKAIQPEFLAFTGIDSMIVFGHSELVTNGRPLALIGYGLKYYLGIAGNAINPLKIYAPKRGKSIIKHKEASFAKLPIQLGGAFSISVEFDGRYLVTPIGFARELFGYEDLITGVEIRSRRKNLEDLALEVTQALNDDRLIVTTRNQKNALIYQTTQSEKWASYAIITFVMLIAVFNVIASLTMLILEKKKDIDTLKAMGASKRLIRRIFYFEGVLINLIGVITGLFFGIVLVWMQETFRFVPLQGSIINYYPVELRWTDLAIILVTVVVMGIFSTVLPVRILSRKYH